MSGYVLDSSAALALILGERGADKVRSVMAQAIISTVNLAEVGGKLLRDGVRGADVSVFLDGYQDLAVDFDSNQARVAADLIVRTRTAGLSLGDRACLALAMLRGSVALTADRPWARIDVGVTVELIR